MNILLGFGSEEKSYREKVKRDIEFLCVDCLNGKFSSLDDVWFTDEIMEEIEYDVKEYAKQTRAEEKEINKLEIKDRPERYSFVYINFAGKASDLFFGISFSHFNSQHPLSPDGMAMLEVRESKWIQVWDFRDGVLDIELKK